MKTFGAYFELGCVAALLHFAWEYLHIPLYAGYENLGSGPGLAIWATTGDVMYTLAMVCLVALFVGTPVWWDKARARDYIGIALLAGLVALMVEYKALALHRWSYAEAMPLIPLLQIGLSPLLQMMILTPAAIFLSKVIPGIRRPTE